MRWRSAATLETIAGVTLVALVGLFLPGHWGLLDLQPHPLWVVVVAIALWYGTPAGYVAGGLAAFAYVALLWTRPETRFQAPTVEELIQPYLLFVGGVLVGELARVQRQRLRAAEREKGETERELAELRAKHERVVAAKGALERRIIGQESSILTLREIARQFDTFQLGSVYPALLDLASEVLRAEACALYVWRDGAFRLWDGRPGRSCGRPQVFPIDTGLGAEVLRQWRVVTVRDLAAGEVAAGASSGAIGDRNTPERGPLLLGPLLNDGQVVGLLVIEAIDFWDFSPTTVRLCEMLLEWAASALARTREIEAMRAGVHQSLAVATPDPALHLLQDEIYRARYYGYPLAVAVVEAPGGEGARLERFVAATHRRCGEAVAVGWLAQPDRCLIVAPTLPPDEARALIATLAAEAGMGEGTNGSATAAPFAAGIAALGTRVATPEQLLATALADLAPLPAVAPPVPNGRYAAAREG